MLDITVIPEGQKFQLILDGGELSITSLALSVLFVGMKEGKDAGDAALLEGVTDMIINVGPAEFARCINSMMQKIDKLAEHFQERPNGPA